MFFAIIVATFEIPFELLVGFQNQNWENVFSYTFYVIFSIDILLNFFSEQLYYCVDSEQYQMTKSVRNSAKRYLFSFWFVVDFLSVFPFEYVMSSLAGLNMARLARLPRLFRAFRAFRGLKGVRLLARFAHAWEINPSYARFLMMFVMLPWFAHVLACFHYYAMGDSATYTTSLYHIGQAFINYTLPPYTNSMGRVIAYLSVAIGCLFFGAFIGNFASLFEKHDERQAHVRNEYQRWDNLFKSDPKVFDTALRKKILDHVKTAALVGQEGEAEELISSLPANIEEIVRGRIGR